MASMASAAEEAVPALIELLADPDKTVRAEAALSLGSFGTKAAEAEAPLTQLLDDRVVEVRVCAARALSKLRPGHVPARAARALFEAVGQPGAPHQTTWWLDLLARQPLAALVEALSSTEPHARYLAARGLREIGSPAKAFSFGMHTRHRRSVCQRVAVF